MKTWTQDMLPLRMIKDLGVQEATPISKQKTRFIEFQCPDCQEPFRATPSKVLSGVVQRCGSCGNSRRSLVIDKESNTKQCTSCEEIKAITLFYKNNRRKDGYDTRCKQCADDYKKSWIETKANNYVQLKAQNSRLIKRYGITSEQYQSLLEKQDYRCAICGNTPEQSRGNTNKLSVDHCHNTGKVRGLLCQKCNTGLGLLGDTKEDLQKALNYLGT